MSYSSDELSDLRRDLGDTGATQAFTDTDLTRLLDRASGDHEIAWVLGIRQLLMQAALFINYTVGRTSVQKRQIWENLYALYQMHAEKLSGVGTTNVQMVPIFARPQYQWHDLRRLVDPEIGVPSWVTEPTEIEAKGMAEIL